MNLRCGFDLDDTIFDFMDYYIKRFGNPKSDFEITKNVQRILSKDREWWLNQPLIRKPNFKAELFCTKRVHPKAWTKKQLEMNDIPLAPVYQVYSQSSSKASRIKGRVDVFIDDSISNFIDMNLNGVPCLLIDSPYNRDRWGSAGRIYSLEYEEIENAYYPFKESIFPYFNVLFF